MTAINEGRRHAFKAGADLSNSQFHLVKQQANGSVILASADTDKIVGILDNAPVQNDTATVTLVNAQGTAKVVLGSGGCAVGDLLTADTNGAAVVTTTNKKVVVGRALQAGNAGEVVEILVANFTISA
jgi:hypothetical protein